MSLRDALTPKSEKQKSAPATKQTPDLFNVLERLIATLNRIENKLDRI